MSDFEIIENTKEAEDTYGRCYGSWTYRISRGDIEALLNGKQLATDNGEYTTFVVLEEFKRLD